MGHIVGGPDLDRLSLPTEASPITNRMRAIRHVVAMGLIGVALPGCLSESTKPETRFLPSFSDIQGTAANQVFLVAWGDGVWRYTGLFWKPVQGLPHGFYSAVWSSGAGDTWLAGNANGEGFIDHYDGRAWKTVQTSPAWGNRSMWGSSAHDLYVTSWNSAGSEVGLLHYDGATWESVAEGLLGYWGYGDVWGSSATDVFATGNGVVHFDGKTWSKQVIPDDLSATAIWGASASDVFAVGGSGTILHFDGTQWTVQRPPDQRNGGLNTNLFDVWGSSAHDVYAVGAYGLVLHYDGAGWTQLARLTGNHLYAVWGSSAEDVTIAGANGAAYHFDGERWAKAPLF